MYMTTATIIKKELKGAIKESVREVLMQELMKLRALVLSSVSQKEQKNIEKLYGRPSRKVAKTVEFKI
jgi:hypothetical protein